MHEVKRVFLSRKTTVTLIALQALIYFLGAIIPQRIIMNPAEYKEWQQHWPALVKVLEAVGLTSVFSSPVTYLLTALFFFHLVLVTWYRFAAIRSAIRLPGKAHVTISSMDGLEIKSLQLSAVSDQQTLREAVVRNGYTVIDGDGCFRGVKHRFSQFGSLLFHLSFLVILAGAITIFHSRFSGGAHVTVGQEFHGSSQEYFHVRRFSTFRNAYPEMHFKLAGIRPVFEKNEATSLRTEIIPLAGPQLGKTAAFDVNFPYTVGSTTMLIKDIGISPYFEVRDQAGRELLGAYISLNILKGDVDHFVIPGTTFNIQVQFWPDFAVDENGYIFSRSHDIRRPLFKITVFQNGREVADGKLHSPAEKIEFAGLQLSYKDISYFGTFNVTDEHGGAVLVSGFALALIGLVIKFLFERREILVLIHRREDNDVASIACKSEYYRSVAMKEISRIIITAGLAEAPIIAEEFKD